MTKAPNQSISSLTSGSNVSGNPSGGSPLNSLKVFLVDDHTVVRQGTRDLLLKHPNISVVGESASGDNLAGLLKLKDPHILLLDINMPGKNGLEILSEIKPLFPKLKIVLFTAHTDIQYIRKGIQLGADGYLSKTVSEQELQEALIKVYSKLEDAGTSPQEPLLSSDVAEKLASLNQSLPQLTSREKEILIMVAQGQTNQVIANQLFLSVKTIDSHVANLIKKLEVNNRSQLTAFAYEQGLL
ncbi:MAG: response regulator transcription factor [Cyanobacteria bacterium]|nr:response regulator transcription factor [Cyanobacteriota bacterium]